MTLSRFLLLARLAYAKHRRYAFDSYEDRKAWDRRVGDIEELISSPSLPGGLARTVDALSGRFYSEQVPNEVSGNVRLIHADIFCPDGFVNPSQTS